MSLSDDDRSIKLDNWPHKHNSKLSDLDVRTIKLMFKENPLLRYEVVMKKYDITIDVVRNIKMNRTWRHILV